MTSLIAYGKFSAMQPINLYNFQTPTTEVATGVYKKQIIPYGEFTNPAFPFGSDERMVKFTDEIFNQIVANFKAGVTGGIIPIPKDHTDSVESNTGEVTSLAIEKHHKNSQHNGLYAYMSIKGQDTIQRIQDGRFPDVSVSLSPDFEDSYGKTHGYTLMHVALVSQPHLPDMNPFESVSQEQEAARVSSVVEHFSNKKFGKLDKVMLFSRQLVNFKGKSMEDESKEIKLEDVDVDTLTAELSKRGLKVVKAEEEDDDTDADEKDNDAEGSDADENDDNADNKEEEGAEQTPEAAVVNANMQAMGRTLIQTGIKQLETKLDNLIEAGQATPAQKKVIMAGLQKVQSYDFALGKKELDAVEQQIAVLEMGPKQFNTKEQGTSGKGKVQFTLVGVSAERATELESKYPDIENDKMEDWD